MATVAACACWLLLACGFAVRLTVRDRYDGWAVAFYALPPAVLAGLALVASLLIGPRRHPRLAALSLALAVTGGFWSYFLGYSDHHTEELITASGKGTTVLFWNACRGHLGWSRVVDQLGQIEPSVIGLVEVPSGDEGHVDFSAGVLGQYKVAAPGYGLALLTRGEISDAAIHDLGRGSVCLVGDIELDGTRVTAVVVDIKSNPLRSRRHAFASLRSLLTDLNDRPLLVMGDFNTPADSVYFDELRSEFLNAFESRGQGFSATWPVPAPILMLDQMWISHDLQVEDCQLLWSWASDHRPVLATIAIVDEPVQSNRSQPETTVPRLSKVHLP